MGPAGPDVREPSKDRPDGGMTRGGMLKGGEKLESWGVRGLDARVQEMLFPQHQGDINGRFVTGET
jgi:hypothetical protein